MVVTIGVAIRFRHREHESRNLSSDTNREGSRSLRSGCDTYREVVHPVLGRRPRDRSS